VAEEELVLELALAFGADTAAFGYPPMASRTDEARVQKKAIRIGRQLEAPREIPSIHKNASPSSQRGGKSGNRAANKRKNNKLIIGR
jgi:hypothetical protein